jgi:hypothetical protein
VVLASIGAGARPCLEFAVTFDEGTKHLGDERSRFHRVAVDVLVIPRVILERCVYFAGKRDAHLHRTKRLGDASEFHNTSKWTNG